jgi:hypothetical protein
MACPRIDTRANQLGNYRIGAASASIRRPWGATGQAIECILLVLEIGLR